MNIHIKLKIPLKNSADTLEVSADTLLNPFYVSERELLLTFLEKYTDAQFFSARESIFYSPKELALFRRNLTLCLATISFGNKFNSDYVKSLSRSKSLAEFSVSTTATNDPQFVVNMIKDATNCVKDAKELLEAIESGGEGLIQTFVKAGLNEMSRESNRLWWNFNLPVKSNETYASKKSPFNGRYYKNGGSF